MLCVRINQRGKPLPIYGDGMKIIVLLGGGSKKPQQKDIDQAVRLQIAWDREPELDRDVTAGGSGTRLYSDDVRAEIAAADCVVLPSYYREGTPRTLLGAAAMGRPIITTDAVGCREVVDDGRWACAAAPRWKPSLTSRS